MSAFRLIVFLWFALHLMGAEPIGSIRDIRRMVPDKAREHPPVKIEAVTTFYHPDWGVLFVHDGTEGICVGVPEEKRPAKPFAIGARLQVSEGGGAIPPSPAGCGAHGLRSAGSKRRADGVHHPQRVSRCPRAHAHHPRWRGGHLPRRQRRCPWLSHQVLRVRGGTRCHPHHRRR